MRCKRPKQALGGSGNSDHIEAAQSEERNIINRRDALCDTLPVFHLLRNQRPRRRRIKRILDKNGDLLGDGGSNGGGVEDLCAEIRYLHRFFVRHLRKNEGRRNDPRIGAEDAVDIGPDFDERGMESRSYNRGRVVRSVAADRRCSTIFRLADKSGDNRNDRRPFLLVKMGEVFPELSVCRLEENRRPCKLVVGGHELACVDTHGCVPLIHIGSGDHR